MPSDFFTTRRSSDLSLSHCGYYETYKCINTKWSHVSNAWNTAQIMLTSGYTAVGNNCLWKAVIIMSHYDTSYVSTSINDGPMTNDESWYKIGTFAECRATFSLHDALPI